jgi:hypothetical protein
MMSGKEGQLLIEFLYRVDGQHAPGVFQILFFLFSSCLILNFTNTGQTDTDIFSRVSGCY